MCIGRVRKRPGSVCRLWQPFLKYHLTVVQRGLHLKYQQLKIRGLELTRKRHKIKVGLVPQRAQLAVFLPLKRPLKSILYLKANYPNLSSAQIAAHFLN